MSERFFPQKPKTAPKIYAYSLPNSTEHQGKLKVGYTTKTANERIQEQLGTAAVSYDILVNEDAIRNDGSTFTDHEVHQVLRHNNIINTEREWFQCTPEQVRSAIAAVRERKVHLSARNFNFPMRPEQAEAVEKTKTYFESVDRENGKVPHFLRNAKMRFGKTFTTYQLALAM